MNLIRARLFGQVLSVLTILCAGAHPQLANSEANSVTLFDLINNGHSSEAGKILQAALDAANCFTIQNKELKSDGIVGKYTRIAIDRYLRVRGKSRSDFLLVESLVYDISTSKVSCPKPVVIGGDVEINATTDDITTLARGDSATACTNIGMVGTATCQRNVTVGELFLSGGSMNVGVDAPVIVGGGDVSVGGQGCVGTRQGHCCVQFHRGRCVTAIALPGGDGCPPAFEASAGLCYLYVASTGGVDARDGEGLKAYPWPPEEPSHLVSLTREATQMVGRSHTELGAIIRGALGDAGYSDARFYGAPGGFVVVTRLEKIHADGTPLADQTRFALPQDPEDVSFLDHFLRLLVEAPPGRWRFMALVVTDESYLTSEKPLAQTEAVERLSRGATSLSPEFSEQLFTPQHRLDILIYEYLKSSTSRDDIAVLVPGRTSPLDHLENSRIGGELEAALSSVSDQSVGEQ